MKTSPFALACPAVIAALLAAPVQADEPAARDVDRPALRVAADMPVRITLSAPALGFAGRELEAERLVKGAPYCATAVHESVQVLADGNRIVHRQQGQLCRDGEGRTRREVQREGGPRIVYLNDPVAKESWVLYPDEKRARRLRGSAGQNPALDPAWQASMQDWGERMKEQAARWKEWGARVAERARSVEAERARARAGGEPALIVEQDVVVAASPGSDAVEHRRELRVMRAGDLPPLPHPPAPMAVPAPPVPPLPLLTTVLLPREGGTTTALPGREIEGVKVVGERTTWTIEAGRIGNEKPIVTTREVWRSPDLMLIVQSREADPRNGEQHYRLEKIRRGEPDPALMKPPADYSEGNRRDAEPAVGAAVKSG